MEPQNETTASRDFGRAEPGSRISSFWRTATKRPAAKTGLPPKSFPAEFRIRISAGSSRAYSTKPEARFSVLSWFTETFAANRADFRVQPTQSSTPIHIRFRGFRSMDPPKTVDSALQLVRTPDAYVLACMES